MVVGGGQEWEQSGRGGEGKEREGEDGDCAPYFRDEGGAQSSLDCHPVPPVPAERLSLHEGC